MFTVDTLTRYDFVGTRRRISVIGHEETNIKVAKRERRDLRRQEFN